jgi:hypothetical protein
LRQVHSLFQSFGERLSRKSYNVVDFPFAFHIAVQQPLKPLIDFVRTNDEISIKFNKNIGHKGT